MQDIKRDVLALAPSLAAGLAAAAYPELMVENRSGACRTKLIEEFGVLGQ